MKKYLKVLESDQRCIFCCHIHGVQADSSQLAGDHLDREPSTLLELMSLCLGYESAPNVQVIHCPRIWAASEDVMRHNVVVAKSRHNGNDKIVGPMARPGISKDLYKLRDHELVLVDNLIVCSRYLLVIVVARRVACPYDEVDFILDVVLYPLERLVDKGKRRVAARRLCAVDARGPSLAMACCIGCCAGICLVERVGVEVCTMT